MGIFDIFKKQKPNNSTIATVVPRGMEKSYDITLNYTEFGRLVVELFERNTKVGQFYDTTKLIIDSQAINLSGNLIQNCFVSWYGRDDCEYFDPQMQRNERRNCFQNILAQIDINLLQTDERYCLAVMKELLNQNRVEEYLQKGLQDNPDRPCGKYVGGIVQKENGYGKIFYSAIGAASHNSPEMIQKREIVKEEARKKSEAERTKKETQYYQLKQELGIDSDNPSR